MTNELKPIWNNMFIDLCNMKNESVKDTSGSCSSVQSLQHPPVLFQSVSHSVTNI